MKLSPRLAHHAGGLKVFVAEDNAPMRKMLVQILELDFDVVAEFSSADTMMQMVVRTAPDVVVCDVDFTGKSGLTALRELRAKGVTVPFVMISIDGRLQAQSFHDGAHAFILKDDLVPHLARAVRAAAAGEHYTTEMES
jgi:DNA-binding NarL/FixJ family response regulator